MENKVIKKKFRMMACVNVPSPFRLAMLIVAMTQLAIAGDEVMADSTVEGSLRLARQKAAEKDFEAAYKILVKAIEQDRRGRTEAVGKEGGIVDGAIAKLDAVNPNFAEVAVKLDLIARDPAQTRPLRAYAEKYKGPCLVLAEAKRFIGKEFDDLSAMRFHEVRLRDKQLQLPPVELCSRHMQLSNHRAKLEEHHRDVQKLALSLETMVNGLAEFGIVNGTCGVSVKRILATKSWQEALTFSCFKGKPPTARRRVPVGMYDELLGVDYTFYNLQALPQSYGGECLRLIGFSPACVEARTAFERLEAFVKFIASKPAWLRRGELGGFYAQCCKLLESRDKLIAFLDGFEGSQRAKLVARFYAGYFSETFPPAKRYALAVDYRELQKEVTVLNEKYEDTSDPIEQIALRSKILDIGIPGDPQIHSKWVALYEGTKR